MRLLAMLTICLHLTAACGKAATKAAPSARTNDSLRSADRTIVLNWDARTGDVAESFRIYGSTSATAAEVPLVTVAANAAGFDAKKPSYTLHSSDKALEPFVGKTLCLAVSAVVGCGC